jgi:hypothetical protein
VERDEIQQKLEEVFDQAIVYHGFADFIRDYDVYVYATADPRTGIPPEHLRYRFTHCVRAIATTAIPEHVWSRSLDDRLIDYAAATASDLDGYVWGVKWQALYPGMTLLTASSEAERWSRALGRSFHEARIQTNGHDIALVFSDLAVTVVGPGEAPFVVPQGGPDFKIPLP